MSDIFMRELVKQAYSGAKWAAKVDKMSERQVIAIFFKLKREGKA